MHQYDKPSSQAYLLRYHKSSPQEYLAHHGILGQKWGKKNGPPYPLDASDHSASEKRAGWRKSLDKDSPAKYNKSGSGKKSDQSEKKGLTDKQKRALKVAGVAFAAALATYGGYKLYKSGKLDGLIEKGKKLTGDDLADIGDKPISDFKQASIPKVTETVNGFKKLAQPESFADTLNKTNPQRGNPLYNNNCVLCAIAGFMRQEGYDVTAGSTGGVQINPAGAVEKCFKGAKIVEGSATKFGRSQKDAAEMLVKRFGENAQGLCGVQWRGTDRGHTFSWKIVDGVVSFFDAQAGSSDVGRYWSAIDLTGNLTLARLDGLEIDLDAISEFIEKN